MDCLDHLFVQLCRIVEALDRPQPKRKKTASCAQWFPCLHHLYQQEVVLR